ncbi:MAG TPA: hypothetical protein VMW16_13950 [Sedimentisphaerales bacterium]|nr:hypothetical protein [Sedimentisphaerales bacterium]
MCKIRTRRVLTVSLVMSLAASAISAPSKKSNLKVLDVQFEPIRQGKNVVRVKVENASEDEQIFRIQIYTRSPDYGRQGVGWGTSFFETIKGRETRWTRFAFKIQGPITKSTYVRLDFHNPGPAAGFDRKRYFGDERQKKWFKRVKYSSGEIEHYKADESLIKPASETEFEAAIQAFRQIQNHIREKKYERAWELFTKDYQDAEFQSWGFEKFQQIMEPEEHKPIDSAFWWQKAEFLSLQPGPVVKKGPALALTAKREAEVWTIDFAQEDGKWKIDWIAGYTPRILLWQNWEERLLPQMEKHSTKHFDIYYQRGSPAEKEIEKIARDREAGYGAICEFLGKDSQVKIKLILFEDEKTKWFETGHQGRGWAYGNTTVEVYNQQEQLDPYHETTHVLMGSLGNPPALFNEGFAVYMSERLGAHALEDLGGRQATIYERARELKTKGEWIELEELIAYTEIGSVESRPPVAYAEAAAFVKFLIDNYGKEKFLRAYKKLKSSDNEKVHKRNVKRLAGIYGKSLEELEKQWKDALLRSELGQKAGGGAAREYEVTIPEEWKQDLSVGKLTLVDSAFYGVPWRFGLFPVVRLNLPVENLTSDTLYFKVNYRTESKKKGLGNSGMGVTYTLSPREKRLIDTIAPIASATRPIRFILRMGQPHHSLDPSASAQTVVVTIDPFKTDEVSTGDIQLTKVDNEDFEVEEVQLAHSEDQGNLIFMKVRNKTDEDLLIGTYVAVNDPKNIETKGVLARPRGFFRRSVQTVPGRDTALITIPYNIPPVGPDPVLGFTLFKPHKDSSTFGERDRREWDVGLVGYGSFNLRRATERGQCVIPVHAPVEERAKLTAQKKSEHFLFRYRPGSYAERNIEKIIREREQAYDHLSSVLQMELPKIVTVDLYPDTESKGLGSGTTYTACNTRSNRHIAEVHSEAYQCDAYHELAHVFSYHFPGYSSNRGGLVEAFAVYFEPGNINPDEARAKLKHTFGKGELKSVSETLLLDGVCEENVVFIDFLLKKDVEKFKEFYVRATRAEGMEDLEKAAQEIYGTDLKGLDEGWRKFINGS